jgi:hypothetical protein
MMMIRFPKLSALALAAILGGTAALAAYIGLVNAGVRPSTSTLAQAIPPASTASIGTGDQSALYLTGP